MYVAGLGDVTDAAGFRGSVRPRMIRIASVAGGQRLDTTVVTSFVFAAYGNAFDRPDPPYRGTRIAVLRLHNQFCKWKR